MRRDADDPKNPRAGHERTHGLWDQLADLPPSKIDDGLELIFRFCGAMVGADNAMWGGGVRLLRGADATNDPTYGWRAPAMRMWKPDPQIQQRIIRFRTAVAEGSEESGSFIRHVMGAAGDFRTHRLREPGFEFGSFRRSTHYRIFYAEAGISDRVCVCFPVNEVTESHFYFDRLAPSPRFGKSDLQKLAYTLRGIKWFHRQLLLRHGVLAAGDTFTPSEWKVLPLLLTDLSEKEIAGKLGLTFDATHKHVRGIFRKLGLRGRAGMLALWQGG